MFDPTQAELSQLSTLDDILNWAGITGSLRTGLKAALGQPQLIPDSFIFLVQAGMLRLLSGFHVQVLLPTWSKILQMRRYHLCNRVKWKLSTGLPPAVQLADRHTETAAGCSGLLFGRR